MTRGYRERRGVVPDATEVLHEAAKWVVTNRERLVRRRSFIRRKAVVISALCLP
jgi:hypothetical protein